MLEINDLSVVYGDSAPALRNVTLRIPDGGAVAVLGSNGAGKSTLLRAISGTLSLHRGRVVQGAITWNGRELIGLSSATIVRAGIAQVPEGRRIISGLTVHENLKLAGAVVSNRRRRDANLEKQLDMFPILRERMDQKAGLLSGGQQQMLAISRALMAEPRLLVLDEPSLGLAPLITEQVAGFIDSIHRSGVSVLLVEQNAAVALRVTDSALLLRVGEMVWSRASAELAGQGELSSLYFTEVSGKPESDVASTVSTRLRSALA